MHSNEWGRFVYRAEWLHGVGAAARAIAVTVELQVQTKLLLLRRIEALGLPPKQADVCFRLASGMKHSAIAAKLGMSTHAVNWHTRQIYARLDVHNAAQLAQKLVGDAALN